MNRKIKAIVLPALLVVFTVAVFFVSFFSSDYFYLFIALIIDMIFVLLLYPKLLSSKHLGLPKIKKPDVKFNKYKDISVDKPKFNIKGISLNVNLKSKATLLYVSFISVLSLFSSYLLIFKISDNSSQSNIVLSYLYSLYDGFLEYAFFYIVGLIAAIIVGFLFLKGKNKSQKILLSFGLTISGVLLSVFFALILTFAFSFVDISNLKRRVAANPQSVGVFVEKEKIVDELHNFENPPNIIGDDKNIEGLIVSLKTQDRSSFYKNKVVPSVVKLTPYKLDLSSNSVLLVDGNLIITKIDKEKIEAISPTVGKLFVEKALAPRLIKDEPEVSLMGRQEYLKYRDDQIKEAVQEIEGYLVEIQNEVNIVYGNISTARNEIASYESWLSTAASNRDAEYNSCISETCYTYSYSYYTGYYSVPYSCNSQAYCNSVRQSWDSSIAENQSGLQEWRNYLASQQSYLAELQELETLFSDYSALVESQKDQTPYELGLFEPDKSIKIVLENTDTSSLADFYATLTHEYLHYTSYVSEERQLDGFFEEGLTEYFARKTVKDNLDVDTNLGYPLISNIILEMVKKVPEESLEDIYFTKDHDALVSLLNQTYGDHFYEDSQLYFTIIQYVPSRDALKVANNIMFKIGGEELTEEDLVSTYSELN